MNSPARLHASEIKCLAIGAAAYASERFLCSVEHTCAVLKECSSAIVHAA
jgi:hypothetical protein